MSALEQEIVAIIAHDGPITLERYMASAWNIPAMAIT